MTPLLLDTHAFLWFAAGDGRLSRSARRAIEAGDAELWLSAASVWEMAIKARLGHLTLPAQVGDYVEQKTRAGLRLLPVRAGHAAGVEGLPFHHRDPFDRLLVVQARLEGMPLVTGDPVFGRYGVRTIW
jgi:PIN domain nuclease of toxin-antitoxin system